MQKFLILAFIFSIISIAGFENYYTRNFSRITNTIKNSVLDVNKVTNLPNALKLEIESYCSNFQPCFEPYAVFNTNTNYKSKEKVLLANNNTWLIYVNTQGIEIFDLIENKVIEKLNYEGIISLDYDPINNFLAFSYDKNIILYDCNTLKIIANESLSSGYAEIIKFSKDFKLLNVVIRSYIHPNLFNKPYVYHEYIKSYSNTLIQPLKNYENHDVRNYSTCNYPDYYRYRSIDYSKNYHIHNLDLFETDYSLFTYSDESSDKLKVIIPNRNEMEIEPNPRLRLSKFSLNRKYFAAIPDISDGQIIIYNHCFKKIRNLNHKSDINSFAFSRNCKWFASASDYGIVKVWDTKTWECIQTSDLHSDEVYSVRFSQDSKKLISSSDGVTILWKLND